MKTSEIARTILEIRKRPSPFVLNGELMVLLGPDGFQEALNRRWLIQDSENSCMRVTDIEAFIEQMQDLSEAEVGAPGDDPDPEVGDSVFIASDGQTYQATVKAREGDGYQLSFPPGKAPNRTSPTYKKAELRRYAEPEKNVPPGSVAPGAKTPRAATPYNPPPGLGRQIRNLPQ